MFCIRHLRNISKRLHAQKNSFLQVSSSAKPEDSKVRFRILKDFFERYKLKVSIGTAIAVIGGITYYQFQSEKSIVSILPSFAPPENKVLAAFEKVKGIEAYKYMDDLAQIERPDLEASLLQILLPANPCLYAVIVGERGCGKSTAVRKVLSKLNTPRGAIYFDCPRDPKVFSAKLLKTLDYQPATNIEAGVRRTIERATKEEMDLDREPYYSFLEVEDQLFVASTAFMREYKRPMVLVLDSVDILAKECPKFLSSLQIFAKKESDMGRLKVVFISGDGSTLPLLMSHSAWSRAEGVFEVGEISDEDAVNYLKGEGIDDVELAKKVVGNISGGLFINLKTYAALHKKGKKYQDILNVMDRGVKLSMEDIGIPSDHKFFRLMLKDSKVDASKISSLGITKNEIEALLAKNILAAHPDFTYTFHGRYIKSWFLRQFSSEKQL